MVYSIVPAADMTVDIDLCGSQYDTKVWVWDQGLGWPLACNDDFYFDDECGMYTSKIEELSVEAGTEYFVVVDGYNGDHGAYLIDVIPTPVCELDCPGGGVAEGEPPLADDVVDVYNGGCGTPPSYPFQALTGDGDGELILCGRSGWHQFEGDASRDTDWFVAAFGPGGVIEATADAERYLDLFELGPQDCSEVGVIQSVQVGRCDPGTMTITGEPGATVWIWAGPVMFESPDGTTPYEFDYVLELTGLAPGTVATETRTWGSLKGLFD